MFLASPLHRQYKTARTETRWHLLLKTWQMPTQTSASRGYVLFSGDARNTQKSLNCLSACEHTRGVLKAWKDMDHRGCLARCGLEMPDFAIRTAAGKFHPEHFTILFLPVPAFLRRVPRIHRGFCTAMIRRPPAPREPVSGRHRRQPGCRLKDWCLHFRCGSLSAVLPNS